ncbi:MAG: glycosyltransferase family 2 protein [Candidatus Thorarchaeota archaeon]
MLVSVIIITLNEAKNLETIIKNVKNAAQFPSGNKVPIEIIVSDGGSTDGTPEIAKRIADKVIVGPKGRYLQLNTGANRAKGSILVFLHADTILPKGAIIRILAKFKNPNIVGGCFKKYWNWNPTVKRSSFLRFANYWWQGLGNWLVNLLRIFPGDNVIFVRELIFKELGGFQPLWICEDFDFSHRLKTYGKKRIAYIRTAVLTSTRRYEKFGFFHTIFLWFRIYWTWRLGLSQKRIKTMLKDVY